MPTHQAPTPPSRGARDDQPAAPDADPFGTSEIRRRVLAGWRDSPARFREDANTEEDFALGGHRDRLIVELAQNAADAAVRAGQPGLLRLVLAENALLAANTGEPLNAAGVQALATLRASEKNRDEAGEGNRVTDDPDVSDESADEGAVVGRFGVGFAAVLAVTDAPEVRSTTGGVRFSRRQTEAEVSEIPQLADDVRRRAGHVPVLRLPYPAEALDSAGEALGSAGERFDTVVTLPFRQGGTEPRAYDIAHRALDGVDDTLLLALPALRRVEIEVPDAPADAPTRVLSDVEQRWRVFRAGGHWNESERAELLADRPTEERERSSWTVTWAWSTGEVGPAGEAGTAGEVGPAVLHAPTPTDERLSLPALLIGSFPLDPSRRRVQAGPLTDRLVTEAARAYVDMLETLAREGAGERAGEGVDEPIGDTAGKALRGVPSGLPVGEFDATLRDAILRLLPGAPLLGSVADPEALVAGRDAVTVPGLDERAARVLAPVVPNLVLPRGVRPATLDVLGVRRVGLADLVEELSGVAEAHPPAWWRELYDACADLVGDPLAAEALGALPVPLADGRTVRGPRGVLLPYGSHGAAPRDALAQLVPYGMRVVHPDAMSATLERLGAVPADPAFLLGDPATRAAVRAATDDAGDAGDAGDGGHGGHGGHGEAGAVEGLDPRVHAVLGLVRAAGSTLEPGSLPWLGELPLPDTDGEPVPAWALLLPGSPAERLLDPDEFSAVDSEVVGAWGEATLQAVGVAGTLGVLRVEDVDALALPDEVLDLPDVEEWGREYAADAGDPMIGQFVAVRDLDLIDDDAWPEALHLLCSEPALREALMTEPRVGAGGVATPGSASPGPYTAWWIARHLGSEPTADPDAEPEVAAVLPAAPREVAALPGEVRERLGTRRRLADLQPDDLAAVLDGLAGGAGQASLDEGDRAGGETLDAAGLIRVWRRLAELGGARPGSDPEDLPEAPARVRVLDGVATRLADDAVVLDSPMWLQLAQDATLGGVGIGGAGIGGAGIVVASPGTAESLAAVLDLPLVGDVAAELLPGASAVVPDESGVPGDVPSVVRMVLPEAPETWYEHDEVRVAGRTVGWWVDSAGRPHAATTEGLARALAWAAGGERTWPLRYAVAAVLADPEEAATALSERAFE